ncbi:unnamed protein product [Darwinula stevensoni]|uniref:FUN14 domain-containing protein 1 n=1 Tax=Darwinula stevensoni TaxID=69355 RepID=A0A7R8XEL4_9CRUS|nr:unnamed protein product [Darwinula stevensoni]CAG0895917.1 unnamed protein product [Darwinula stevensoni]
MPGLAKHGNEDKHSSSKKEDCDLEKTMDKIVEDSKSALATFLQDVHGSSPMKQILIGTGTGCASGYMVMRMGKLAAFAIGGTTLVLLVASQKGYIHVNWKQVTDAVSDTIRNGATSIPRETTITRKITKFAGENMLLTVGFLGGFFLGMSFS